MNPLLFFFSPSFFPPCFSVVFLCCVVSWFQSLMLAEEHLCPLLAVAFICFLLQKLSVVFFSKRNQSVCQSLRFGFLSASSRGCRCKLLHFPLECFITEELTVKPNLLSVHPYRSRRLQRGPIPVRSRGQWAPKHRYRRKFISQIHFLFSCVFKNESIRTAAYTDIGEIKQELLHLFNMITDINTEASVCCNHGIRYTAEICFK